MKIDGFWDLNWEYNHKREMIIHSMAQLDLCLALIQADIDKTKELCKLNESIATLYYPEKFEEKIMDPMFFEFFMTRGYIININIDEKYDTYVTITHLIDDKEEKTAVFRPRDVWFHGNPTDPIFNCLEYVMVFFNSPVSFLFRYNKEPTESDYEQLKSNLRWVNEEQMHCLFQFIEEKYRHLIIQYVGEMLNEEWIGRPEKYTDEVDLSKMIEEIVERAKNDQAEKGINEKMYDSQSFYKNLHKKFSTIINGEVKVGLTDYDVIVFSFDKGILKDEVDQFKNDNNEQAVAFLEECLKRYNE